MIWETDAYDAIVDDIELGVEIACLEGQDYVGDDFDAVVADIEELHNLEDELGAGVANSDGWDFVVSNLRWRYLR